MKDWKFIKVENKDTPELRSKLRDIEEQIKNWEHAKSIKGVDIHKAQKIIDDLRKDREKLKNEIATGNESIEKQEWSMFNGLRNDAEKEIGNAGEEWYTFVGPKQSKPKYREGQSVKTREGKGTVTKIQPMKMSSTPTYKIRLDSGKEVWVYEEEIGNSKTGNATGDEYNAEIQRLTKKAEQLRRMGQGRQAMEVEKQIEKLGKELRELGNKKTGNSKWKMRHGTVAEVKEDGTVIYSKNGMTSTEKFDSKEKAEKHLQFIGSVKIGNEKTVNQSAQYRLLDDIEFIKDDYKKSGKKLSFGLLLYELNRYGWDDYELRKLKIPTNIGNEETKAERKFGKVMGEFEEGSLKTPQGKTVTDPAQAKAIAYSEADKVDNLKRARNAMNKKVKNSSVREYKDSQGRIAQIDFNSDGTDADMAIYEDERMSKSVEQRNFSTIRDAEQYVQSHGFRRVG